MMKRLGWILITGIFGGAAISLIGLRYVGGSEVAAGQPAPPASSVAGELEAQRHPVVAVPPRVGGDDRPRVAVDLPDASPVVSGSGPSSGQGAADATLAAFMDARMHRDAAAAEPYLSAKAHHRLCPDWTCMGLIGTSNPHHASWEVVSRSEEGNDTVLFEVRIHEEITDVGEVYQLMESIEIGPGENYLGETMDAVVLEDSQ
jgi:hypothetical protein